MSNEIWRPEDPIRWIDAVRRRDSEMSIADAAETGQRMDHFVKKYYAQGYDVLMVKVGENGDLDLKAPHIRRILSEGDEQ